MDHPQPIILCLASYFKGGEFIETAHDAGARVLFMTQERYAGEAWPYDHIDRSHAMPDTGHVLHMTNAVSWLARSEAIDRIVPLDDYDVLTAAALREHLRLPGLGQTQARTFRDKLAMRTHARATGLPVPPFCGIFSYDRLRAFMDEAPGPWLLKPRTEAGAMGIRHIDHPGALWPLLDQMGDDQSHFLLEKFIPGDVYHVDAIVHEGALLFTAAHKYAQPPLNVAHEGGVFVTRTMDPAEEETQQLLALHERFTAAFGMRDGVAHTEFIRAHEDGQWYFLETAARVGGANIADLIAAASGINLWREWARLETALAAGRPYTLPPVRSDYAGVAICLARQEQPDLSGYRDPEIVWRMAKPHHAGLIVAASDPARVAALLDEYARRFAADFLTTAPPLAHAP